MSRRERRRLELFSRVKQGLISVAEAGRYLAVSERQAQRMWKRYKQDGDGGLIHGLRGRKSNASKEALRKKFLSRSLVECPNYGPAHTAGKLAEGGLVASRISAWRWMKADGRAVSHRRVSAHRSRRVRRAQVGSLVQMDGSTHHWFGRAYSACVLFVMIDDASSRVWARFYASEDMASAFDLFGSYVRRYGLPQELYVDRDSIYRVNDEDLRQRCVETGQKAPLTQFGRAMEQLGVGMIFAHSPQAKGRVERMNRTLQDRLVKELAAAKITDITRANRYLEKIFLRSLYRATGVKPSSPVDHHRALGGEVKLAEILCRQEYRVVGRDWCVHIGGRILQIDKKHGSLALAGRRIQLAMRADLTIHMTYKEATLIWRAVPQRPAKASDNTPKALCKKPQRPGPNHPWRRGM